MSASRLIFDNKRRVGDWVAEQMPNGASWHDYYAMGAEQKGELVSGIVFESFNRHNANAHIAISKPTKLFIELLDHAFVYSFETMQVQRLTALVEADHIKSLQVCLHIGFQVEAVMQNAGSSGQNLLILVLWPENYYRGERSWARTIPHHPIMVH